MDSNDFSVTKKSSYYSPETPEYLKLTSPMDKPTNTSNYPVINRNSIGSSISNEDSRVLFWDIGKRECIASHRLDFIPTVFDVSPEGTLLFIASQDGVFRIFDITRRTILRLLYQMKFDYKSSHHIDRILVHPLMKYIIFYKKGGRYLFFISGELSKKFVFLGFLKVPTKILDVCIHNVQGEDFTTEPTTLAGVLVLVRGMLLYYNIFKFFVDNTMLGIK